jgi:phage tail sheath gpL-like
MTRRGDGPTFAAKQDAAANLLTFGGTLNDPHLSVLGTYGSPTPDYVSAAAFARAAAPPIKPDPALPLQTIPILGILGPKKSCSRGIITKRCCPTDIALPSVG